MSHTSTKPQYDAFAKHYVSMEELPSERVAANLFRNTVSNLARGLKVLDLACGTGTYARVLLDHEIADQVTGVDISSEMVRIGREIEVQQRPGKERIHFNVGDCTIPLQDQGIDVEPNSFDLVMGNWLFNYAANSMQLTAMWRNVAMYLRPGGTFVGLLPDFDVKKALERSAWNGITFEKIGTVAEGIKVHVTAHCSPPIEFDNYLLDGKIHEQIPLKVGMEEVVYTSPTESDLPEITSAEEVGKWKEYLKEPVSHICVAIKA
jgi:SAM-dependent methyltransferase